MIYKITTNWFERWMIITAQFLLAFLYVFVYIHKVAHRMVGYFEEQAVISYTLTKSN